MTVSAANSPEAILSAWMALEVLTPPAFREPEDMAAGDRRAVARLSGRVMPWDDGEENLKPNARLYYQLILGAVNLDAAMKRIRAVCTHASTETRASRGRAILAVAILDHRGVPIKNDAVAVSSFAWAFPRVLAGKLESLSAWPKVAPELNDEVTCRLKRSDAGGNAKPLTAEVIRQAFDWLIRSLDLPPEVLEAPRYALRTFEPSTRRNPPEHLLLNSFHLSHLMSAAEQFQHGTASENLKLFLGAMKPKLRRDLLNDRIALRSAVRPELFSPARWPGPGRRPLVLLQQAAVNMALRELKDHGILAVNGPPGTGKTTLLRDIVAGLVTERARAMAAFDDPAAAFVATGQFVQMGKGRFQLYQVDPKLRGFEILVASSNNKAVENISAELPGKAAIANDAPELRYFRTTSDALQTSQRGTWGLIAAVLGNSLNRNRFKKIFWWDKDVGLSSYLRAASGQVPMIQHIDPDTGAVSQRPARVVTDEQAPASREDALIRWQKARLAFGEALRLSQRRLDEVETLHAFHVAESGLPEASRRRERAHADLQAHLAIRPSWWEGLLFMPESRSWRRRVERLAGNVGDATLALAEMRAKVEAVRTTLRDSTEALRRRLGTRLVDDRFFDRKRTEYQQEAPWLDDQTHRGRDDVFIAAMALHKAFIDVAARPIRHNLGALMSTFGGTAPPSTATETAQVDLWATLFLVVPVLSTTFASVDRMLGKLPSESLGWLLVDEAGQAPPQAALGALMKTRRAVIVGDPMQIEPVVTLPVSLTETICRRFGVDPHRFNAPLASIQTLADAATSCMASFEGQHGQRTVGVPLLIHRRCAEPMFGLSNAVAYDRQMINARTPEPSAIRARLGPSQWFDIQGEALEKWCPQEGQCVIGMLRELARGNIDPDLYVVTPFMMIQDRMREVLLNSGVLDGWVAEPRDWIRQRVGTVHVAQGREAEAVIFVLGAQGIQHLRARSWAGGRPNLLNVAVSRAKEALYVVGNRSLWATAGLFSELDAQLPKYSLNNSLVKAS